MLLSDLTSITLYAKSVEADAHKTFVFEKLLFVNVVIQEEQEMELD